MGGPPAARDQAHHTDGRTDEDRELPTTHVREIRPLARYIGANTALRQVRHQPVDMPLTYHGAASVLCQRIEPDAAASKSSVDHVRHYGDRTGYPAGDKPGIPRLGLVLGCLLSVPDRDPPRHRGLLPASEQRGGPDLVVSRLRLWSRPQNAVGGEMHTPAERDLESYCGVHAQT